jgi:hypothetical protein
MTIREALIELNSLFEELPNLKKLEGGAPEKTVVVLLPQQVQSSEGSNEKTETQLEKRTESSVRQAPQED